MFGIVVGLAAVTALVPSTAFGRRQVLCPAGTRLINARMCDNLDTPGEDGASLSSSFAAELARRQDGQQAGAPTQASSVTEEPFTGVREIVVRDGP